MSTLKTQRNGLLCSNTVIGTLAADGWAVTFGTVRRGLGGLQQSNFLLLSAEKIQVHVALAFAKILSMTGERLALLR